MYLLGRIPRIFVVIFCFFANCAIADSWESPVGIYTVKSGDNWTNLGKKINIPAKALQRYNKSFGKKIYIPAKKIYQVKDGETSLGIAVKYGMTFSELITLNYLEDPYEVKAGQKLKVIVLKPQNKSLARKVPHDVKLKMIWPLKGKITSKFGGQKNGANYDGIRILGRKKTNKVKAVSKGEVVYVGNEVGSYGNLVIIQHNGDWFSSYGHLTTINVIKGEGIKSGAVIGDIEDSELYFSLRKSEKAVDPQKYLPKLVKRKK